MKYRRLRREDAAAPTYNCSGLRILSIPARRNAAANPFTAILASTLEGSGHRVDDIRLQHVILARYDIVLMHWPQGFATLPFPISLFKVIFLHLLLLMLRLRGSRVVWLVHDVGAMVKRTRWLNRWHMNRFVRWVDGLVFLSESSRESTFERYPRLRQKPSLLSFHPVPLNDATQTKGPVFFEDPLDQELLGFIGDIRPSKGLLEFLTLCASERVALKFCIVGECDGGSRDLPIARVIDQMNRQGSDVRWVKRRLSAAEFDDHIRAVQVVLLPYLWGWNSGLALQALFARRRVLATDLPIFRELREILGPYWIQIYDGTAASLKEALALIEQTRVTQADHDRLDWLLRQSTWEAFGESMELLLYRTVQGFLESDLRPLRSSR